MHSVWNFYGIFTKRGKLLCSKLYRILDAMLTDKEVEALRHVASELVYQRDVKKMQKSKKKNVRRK